MNFTEVWKSKLPRAGWSRRNGISKIKDRISTVLKIRPFSSSYYFSSHAPSGCTVACECFEPLILVLIVTLPGGCERCDQPLYARPWWDMSIGISDSSVFMTYLLFVLSGGGACFTSIGTFTFVLLRDFMRCLVCRC